MTPDETQEPDIVGDPLLRALSELPRDELDAWRSERLRSRAHAELKRGKRPFERTTGALELLLMAACGVLALGRLAMLIALIAGP